MSWFMYTLSHLLAKHLSEEPSSIHLIASLSVKEGCLQVILPLKHLLQAEQAPFPHLLRKGVHFIFQLFWSSSIDYIPVIQCLSWTRLGERGKMVSKPQHNIPGGFWQVLTKRGREHFHQCTVQHSPGCCQLSLLPGDAARPYVCLLNFKQICSSLAHLWCLVQFHGEASFFLMCL